MHIIYHNNDSGQQGHILFWGNVLILRYRATVTLRYKKIKNVAMLQSCLIMLASFLFVWLYLKLSHISL